MRERASPTTALVAASPQSKWNTGVLGDVIADVRGGFSVNSEDRPTEVGELGVLKTGSVLNGRFRPEEHKTVLASEANRVRTSVAAGTIIICRKNSEDVIGASALVGKSFPSLFLSDLLWQITPRDDVCRNWLAAVIGSERIRGMIRISSTGTQASMKNISQDRLLALPVSIPPLPEQRKIAEILQTWDEALEKLTALRAAKQERFTGLKQQIMGRGGILPQQWPLEALSVVSTPVRRKSAGGNHSVMTISAKSGFLMQSHKFARDMAGQSVERYTLLHEGEFAYNKGNSKTAPYGCVFRLHRPTALVPFVYYCFAVKPALDPEFYEHLFAAGALNHQLSRLINSGVRNDGLLNLYSDDFYSCRVPVPPIDEQRRIARTLTAAKQELALLNGQIEVLTRQKRGLMQKLLTGEWRVELEEPVD